MEVLTFGHAGAKVLICPTREGRFYDYENWGLVGALTGPIERGLLHLFCVDSVDREAYTAAVFLLTRESFDTSNTSSTCYVKSFH